MKTIIFPLKSYSYKNVRFNDLSLGLLLFGNEKLQQQPSA